MQWMVAVISASASLILLIAATMVLRPLLTTGPRGEVGYTLLWLTLRVFCRLVHRIEYVGFDKLPRGNVAGPLLIVSNHTGGVDPLLIGSSVRFHIRWMMARETMSADSRWFWDFLNIIPVDRDGRDMAPAREAIRDLRRGGVIGIFPEGGIANPPRQIRPFMEGVGLIVAKSNAPVALLWVSGTTFTKSAFGSVLRRSRARVKVLDVIDFSAERDPRRITQILRERLAEASGWPLVDEPLPSSRSGAA